MPASSSPPRIILIEDNGIKFFRHDGYKLDDQIEEQIEQLVFTGEIDSIRPTARQNRTRHANR